MATTTIKKPIFLDDTAQAMNDKQQLIADQIAAQNAILKVMAGSNISAMYSDFKQLRDLARTGEADKILSIGDQITVPWVDKSSSANTSYDMPFDIVSFDDVELQDGETRHGIWLQSHYATLYGVQFGQAEALYVATTELPAGTYNFSFKSGWGTYVKTGVTYQFTLTKAVPAGGQIRGMIQAPDKAPASWRISTYASNTSTTAIETVTPTEGSDGTSLGVIPYDKAPDTTATYPLNNIQRVAYGNNRWQNSAMEQWLNSKAAAGAWWTPRDEYDVPPDQLATKPGFMSGFSDDFLAVLGKVKVTTYKNTTAYDGSADVTYDTFFLPALEQIYANKQIDGEGAYWPYWKEALGLTSPSGWYDGNKHEAYKTFALENHASAQYVRLRSANRGGAGGTWTVNAGGYVHSGNLAWYANRCAPACVIC